MNDFIIDAFGAIDEKTVEMAGEYKPPKKRRWLIPAIAAGIAAAAAIPLMLMIHEKEEAVVDAQNPPKPQGVFLGGVESTNDETEDGKSYDSLCGFLKINGRIYWYMEAYYDTKVLAGEKLGKITNKLEPVGYSDFDALPDMSGYELGPYYAVNGFDPEFMVCTKDKDFGRTLVYLNNTGFEIVYGSEIIEDRYGVSDKYTSLTYESGESIEHMYDERYLLDPACRDAALDFVKVLDEGVWTELEFGSDEYMDIVNNCRWRLEFMLGIYKLKVDIYEGGFARVGGINAYLKFDTEKAAPFFELMASGKNAEAHLHESGFYSPRIEDTSDVPVFGEYVPEIPEGYKIEHVFVSKSVDDSTGRTGNIEMLSIEYRGIGDWENFLKISIYPRSFLSEMTLGTDEVWRCDAPYDEVSEANIRGNVRPDDADGGEPYAFRVCAYDEKVCIVLDNIPNDSGLSQAEMITLIKSCFEH